MSTVYATGSDLLARYPEDFVGQLTGSPRGTTVDMGRLQVALDDAHAEVNDYLAARFPLPLETIPPSLVVIVCDIAIYRLQVLRPTGDMEQAHQRYKDAVRRLDHVAKRQTVLAAAPPSLPSVSIRTHEAVFTDSTLDRFSGRLR